MRLILFLPSLSLAVNFGDSSSNKNNNLDKNDLSNRNNYGNNGNNGFSGNSEIHSQCCCVQNGHSCAEDIGQGLPDDLVGDGLIHERIVNRVPGSESLTCPYGSKLCCYEYDYSVFGRTCVAPSGGSGKHPQSSSGNYNQQWNQRCTETQVYGNNQCGTRNYNGPSRGIRHGESSPGELPWICLVLNENDDFLGACAIVPETSSNDLRRGTRKVITAAHNINKIPYNTRLKVRVGEYNAGGFKSPEQHKHVEYYEDSRVLHPKFNSKRLNDDIAVLKLTQTININHPYVNAACFPSCEDQFGDFLSDGTSKVKCWVGGWGKDEFDGNYQYNQRKVDIPLVSNYQCQRSLKEALNRQRPGTGDRFQLQKGEICAGSQTGKDACTGDGGSPLVCQGKSGRWTVVGLVAWGIGCGNQIPGVYTRVSYYSNWISRV